MGWYGYDTPASWQCQDIIREMYCWYHLLTYDDGNPEGNMAKDKAKAKKPARRKRPGEWAILYAEVPPVVKAALERRAKANRRSATAELIVLMERDLAPEILAETSSKE